MKKTILACAFGLSLLALPSFSSINSTKNSKVENLECNHGQCSKIKSNGQQCKNCSQKDSYYCWSHRN